VRSRSSAPVQQPRVPQASNFNVDGAVRDEDMFIVGDAEDDEGDDVSSDLRPEDSYIHTEASTLNRDGVVNQDPSANNSTPYNEKATETIKAAPLKYHITKDDTLRGITLRFGLDVSPIKEFLVFSCMI
jgi:hypothetical protein